MENRKLLSSFSRELRIKRYSQNTVQNYISCLGQFLEYFRNEREAKGINQSQIKDYLASIPSEHKVKQNIGCLKLFFRLVVKQPNKLKGIEYPNLTKCSPILLSDNEIKRLFSVIKNTKHYTILLVAYSTGVRVSELLDIRLSDIDRDNGVIHILNGKGGKQRMVTMPNALLQQIETYWREYRTKEFLFEGQFGGKYTASSINKFLKHYAAKAGIKKKVHIHLLRHLYATSCLDAGENLHLTQRCLGHKSPKTTADFYYHLTSKTIATAYSPIGNVV